MISELISKYRFWSAEKDLKSAFASLTRNAVHYGHGATMVFDGPYSLAVFTSNPEYVESIRAIVAPVFKEGEEHGE